MPPSGSYVRPSKATTVLIRTWTKIRCSIPSASAPNSPNCGRPASSARQISSTAAGRSTPSCNPPTEGQAKSTVAPASRPRIRHRQCRNAFGHDPNERAPNSHDTVEERPCVSRTTHSDDRGRAALQGRVSDRKSPGFSPCAHSHQLRTLHLLPQIGAQRERAVLVQLLMTRPTHRIPHPLHLNLSAKLQSFPIADVRHHELRLPNLSRQRITGVQATALERLPVRALHGHPQHARHARNAVIGEAHNQPQRTTILIAPDERRPHSDRK